MTTIEYNSEPEMTEMVASVIANERLSGMGALREHSIKVLACAAVRVDDDGETQTCSGPPVKLRKVPEALRAFIKDKARFVLVIDYGTWENWDDTKRMAYVYAALASISVEKGQNGLKIKTEKPDIMEHSSTIAHFGVYNPSVQRCDEALRDNAHRIMGMVSTLQRAHEAAEDAEGCEPDPLPEVERPRIKTATEVMQPESDQVPDEPDLKAPPVPRLPRRGAKK